MIFGIASINTLEAKNEKEFQEILAKYMYPGEISEETLTRAMHKVFPNDEVMVTDPAEQQQRAALCKKMQDAMTRCLHDGFEANLSRQALKLPRPKYAFDRCLSATVLNLPHIEQNEEYVRRYTILASGTPEQKTELVLELFQAEKDKLAAKGWTRERLKQMTNDELAENFEELQELMAWQGEMENLCKSRAGLKLTAEQEDAFMDFEREYNVIPWMCNRMEVLSSPHYSTVRMDSLPAFDNSDLDYPDLVWEENAEDEELESEENIAEDNDAEAQADDDELKFIDSQPSKEEQAEDAIKELFGSVERQRQQLHTALRIEVESRTEGVFNSAIQWLDENGKQLWATHNPRYTRPDKYDPPLDELAAGQTLTAILPNGTKKIFSVKEMADGSLNFHVDSQRVMKSVEEKDKDGNIKTVEKPMSRTDYMDQHIKAMLPQLEETLNQADPWYIKSSPEFKGVQKALKNVQKEWRAIHGIPTQAQVDKLQQQMESLNAASEAYFGIKEGKYNFNEREQARLDAVKSVVLFARQQLTNVRALNSIAARRENADERAAFEESNSQAARDRRNDAFEQQREQYDHFERSNDIKGVVHPKTSGDAKLSDAFYSGIGELQRISCPPTKETGDTLERLRKTANSSLHSIASWVTFRSETMAPIPSDSHAPIKRNMATVTLFHLIMTERSSQPADTAGPLEQVLAKQGVNAMVDSIEKLPAFNNLIGDITPTRLIDFITNSGARNIAKQLVSNSRDNRKQAENPAPEKAAKKDMAQSIQQ